MAAAVVIADDRSGVGRRGGAPARRAAETARRPALRPAGPAAVGWAGSRRFSAAVYWRRRLLVASVAVALAAGTVLVASRVVGGVASRLGTPGDVTSPVDPSAAPAPGAWSARADAPFEYVVQPGDTLWTIARRLDPGGDPRLIVHRLSEQSQGSALRPGQRLSLREVVGP